MIIAFISIALVSQFGSPSLVPVGDRTPVINVERTCRDTSAADKEANLALAPADDGDVVLVAAAPNVPHGFVRRLLDMVSQHALQLRRLVA